MKQFLLIGAAMLAACSISAQKKSTPGKPNIVLILADDLGYSDIGSFGSEISTPNLDKLAAEGIRLTQFYNAGRCCPSRAALLTGLYPHQASVGDMLQKDELPAYDTHLNFNSVTLAEVLKGAGYHTIISGKWHVGSDSAHWPTQRGFQDQYFSEGTTGHYFGLAKGRRYVVNGHEQQVPGEWIKAGETDYKLLKNADGSQWYATDAIADHAIGFVKKHRNDNKDQPFFLYLPFTAPHWPLHALDEDIRKYKGRYQIGWDSLKVQRFKRMQELGLIDSKWKISGRNENVKPWNELSDSARTHYAQLMEVYAAMVDRLDQNIGKVVQSLRETGDLDNTVILFLADNGGCHEVVHRGAKDAVPGSPDSFDGYEYGWAGASNTPFQWFKHWAHEGGTSSPFIAWYPLAIRAGTTSNAVGYIADLMPTLADLAKTSYPKSYKGQTITPLAGKSLLSLLKGQTTQGRESIFWEHEGNRAVRKGDWKLVSRFDYQKNEELPWELYNIREDRPETRNLAAQQPRKYNELKKAFSEWAKSVQVVPYKELLAARKLKVKVPKE